MFVCVGGGGVRGPFEQITSRASEHFLLGLCEGRNTKQPWLFPSVFIFSMTKGVRHSAEVNSWLSGNLKLEFV